MESMGGLKKAHHTILVTGGTGFLGSHIVRHIINNGDEALVIHRHSSSVERLKDILCSERIFFFDTSIVPVEDIFLSHGVDFVIHTATVYGRAIEDISDMVYANLWLPLRLLEISLRYPTTGFLNADTFFNEDQDLPDRRSLYVAFKKDFLSIGRRLVKESSTDIKFINMRIEQMYGPADHPDKVVPSLIKSLLSGKEILHLTRGEQKRDFVFVEDVAAAFMQVIQHSDVLERDEEFGIGSGSSLSLRDFVELAKDLTGSMTRLDWGALPYRKNEIMDSAASLEHNKKIDWNTRYTIESGLEKTIQFYKALQQ